MSFESKVLTLVAEILKDKDAATIFNGTLFVDCTPISASVIETALINQFKCGVIVTPCHDEFAFDFTN